MLVARGNLTRIRDPVEIRDPEYSVISLHINVFFSKCSLQCGYKIRLLNLSKILSMQSDCGRKIRGLREH
jgi:hypothetical protein